MKESKDVIIIPAYCPSQVLLELVDAIDKTRYQIIVVDDGSGEKYASIFQQLPLVLTHEMNLGKGAAIKTAFRYVQEQMQDLDSRMCIATMDCDGQHTVEDVIHVLEAAREYPGKLILGARDFRGEVPWKSKLGNYATRVFFRISQKVSLQDTQTGLRAFSADLLPKFLQITGDRYEYEMRVLFSCGKEKISIMEVPIQTIYHDKKNSETHFRAVKDSILIYKDVIKFTLSSMSSFLVDYILFGIFIMFLKNIPEYILISNILARFISAAYNYLVNAKLVFKMKKPTVKSAIQYFMLALFMLCMNNLILSFILYMTGLPAMVAKIITELILFIMSYLIQHVFIFRKTDHKKLD